MRHLLVACIPLVVASVLTFVVDMRFHGQGTRFHHSPGGSHTVGCVRYAVAKALFPFCLFTACLTLLSIVFGR